MKTDLQTNEALHPSFLALDRAHLGAPSLAVTAHLAGCEACRDYVQSPGNAATASGFAALQQAIDNQSKPRSRWLWAASTLVAAACALLLVVPHRTRHVGLGEEVYVGAKGFRSVWIYVKRGTETQLWDGKRALAPGDRIRLKVDPGSYHQVAVYAAAEPPTLLYTGKLTPGENLTLPEAWEIDDSPSNEQLFVVFSEGPVEPKWGEWRRGLVPAGVALLPFTLPKARSAAGAFDP